MRGKREQSSPSKGSESTWVETGNGSVWCPISFSLSWRRDKLKFIGHQTDPLPGVADATTAGKNEGPVSGNQYRFQTPLFMSPPMLDHDIHILQEVDVAQDITAD